MQAALHQLSICKSAQLWMKLSLVALVNNNLLLLCDGLLQIIIWYNEEPQSMTTSFHTDTAQHSGCLLELQTKVRKDLPIMENAPTKVNACLA